MKNPLKSLSKSIVIPIFTFSNSLQLTQEDLKLDSKSTTSRPQHYHKADTIEENKSQSSRLERVVENLQENVVFKNPMGKVWKIFYK
mgnify:FL=1